MGDHQNGKVGFGIIVIREEKSRTGRMAWVSRACAGFLHAFGRLSDERKNY